MACSMWTHPAEDFENLAVALATFVSSPLSNLASGSLPGVWAVNSQATVGKCAMKVGKSDGKGIFAATGGNARRFPLPELGRAPRVAIEEADAGQYNGLCHDLQRHRGLRRTGPSAPPEPCIPPALALPDTRSARNSGCTIVGDAERRVTPRALRASRRGGRARPRGA